MTKSAIEVVNEFKDNGIDPSEYTEIINDLLISYTKEDEYNTMLAQERCNVVQRCREIKDLIKGLGAVITSYMILVIS